jgi:predicted TIM-barrel fold metal-dependent hydrolase
MNTHRRIDTHFHIVPDFYAQAVEETGGDPSGWPTPGWSLEQARTHMKELGISSAIVSVTAPGTSVYADDIDKGRALARKCNEYCAKLAKDEPTRFGWFATLPPLTDVAGCLKEINYAFHHLGADGVTVLSTHPYNGTSLYLGNELVHPVWEKLNSINAVAFIHPSGSIMPQVNKYAPKPLFDYPQETTRTAADLILSGTKAKYPNVKMILSHAGGTLAFLAPRVFAFDSALRTAEQLQGDFRSFYFDTALSSSNGQLRALLDVVDPTHIFFGSDVPYAPIGAVKLITTRLDDFFSDEEYKHLAQKVDRENALALFPKFSKATL